MPEANEIKETIKTFILEEFLPGEPADQLTDAVELMTLGILDSVAILKLVTFVEERFKIMVEPHELDKEHLNTLPDIARMVASKL